MNCVILAGGFGSRLRPLTDSIPKPMLPVANQPMIDYVVSHLYAAGIKDLVLTLGYKPLQICEWMTGYERIVSRYVFEDSPLGTAGGVKAAEDLLSDTFIVMSGDALENIDLSAMAAFHFDRGFDITMAVTKVSDPSLYGVVQAGADGRVTAFCEKPPHGTAACDVVNCGVYMINRSVLRHVPSDMPFDFSRDLFPLLLSRGSIGAYRHDGYWSDIGDVRSYYEANFYMGEGGFFEPTRNRMRFESAMYVPPRGRESLLGNNASIVGDCSASIIGHRSSIVSGASCNACVVMPNVTVKGNFINAIVGSDWHVTVPTVDLGADSPEFYNIFS